MKHSVIIFIFAFLLSLLFCKLSIPLLKKWKAGQNILSYVKEHEKKSGTPTMGGLAFVLSAIVAFFVLSKEITRTSVVCIAFGFSYLIVGLIDDLLKKKHKENLGLTAWQKIVFQTVAGVFAGVYAMKSGIGVKLPFTDKTFGQGFFMLPFTLLVFLSTVNCVNLTDGLDGLVSSVCVPFFLFLGLIIFLITGKNGLTDLCFSLSGALVAYLIFNVSPARVFMGDTGSLSLGGFASAIALFSENALLIPILGFCFVVSGISVVLQVIYYKATKGKRVFLMAPVHHHFQMKGYSETQISYAYAAATALLGLVCLLPYLI